MPTGGASSSAPPGAAAPWGTTSNTGSSGDYRGASAQLPYGQPYASSAAPPWWSTGASDASGGQTPAPTGQQPANTVPLRPLGSFAPAPSESRTAADRSGGLTGSAATTSGGTPTARPVTNDPASVILSREPIVRTISPPARESGVGGTPWGTSAASQSPSSSLGTAAVADRAALGNSARTGRGRTNITELPDADAPNSNTPSGSDSAFRSAIPAPAYGDAVAEPYRSPASGDEASAGPLNGPSASTAATSPLSRSTDRRSDGVSSTTGPTTGFKADAPYGYDTNYQWLRGRLENNGSPSTWRIVYVPPLAPPDQFGGTLPLANPNSVSNLSPGKLVELHGRLVRVWARGTLTYAYYVTEVRPIDSGS